MESVVFGGQILTASDLAVAGGLVEMDDSNLLSSNSFTCDNDCVKAGVAKIRQMVEETIDQVKVNILRSICFSKRQFLELGFAH